MFGKQKLAAIGAEFFGTFVLASAVFAITGRTDFPFFSGIVAGLTVGLLTLVFGLHSGAHFNPAVTLGLWSIRKLQTVQAIVYVAAQAIGGLIAWRLNEYLLNQPLSRLVEPGVDWRVVLAEALGAFVFTVGVAAAVYRGLENGHLAFVVGGSLAVGILVASIASNGIVNPAVALGLNSFSWAYACGPLLGAILGMNTYALLFAPAPVRVAKASTRRKK